MRSGDDVSHASNSHIPLVNCTLHESLTEPSISGSCIQQCRDAINQIRDLVNFVRESPKRLAWFGSFQQQDTGALRPLCPARWTMQICSVKSVLDNYNELLYYLEEVSHTEHGKFGFKSSGYFKQLSTFSMYFSLKLLCMVFARSKTLAQSLQSPSSPSPKLKKYLKHCPALGTVSATTAISTCYGNR